MRRLLALAILAMSWTLFTGAAEARHGYHHHHHHYGYRHHHRHYRGFHRHLGRRMAGVSYQPQVHGMGCLRPTTRAMIGQLTSHIGAIQITSTCGGRHAHNSQHYRGNAIDFRPVHASVGQTLRVLHAMPIVGGIGSYSGGLIHADVGERTAEWHGHGRHYAHRHHYHTRYAHHHRYRWS